MGWFREVAGLIDHVAKSDVVRGMILQANSDIYLHKTDRENGYTEVKYANEGDDLEVLCEDLEIEGGFRVINRDNHDQIETVQLTDLDDGSHS
ncbi:hypothetical protein ST201phi2-1p401 [Pseudomonas phage 201phi2-1]|uniref:Uncharacterized protein n=1 Tax=Pseudomonas phage 201phi2-1 TaxID=198110 RepID=B3FJR0_BP201|nr:hypothetical protein ST201phi2-1p401 [Pseudomonas phage 201phi2-1]ABY63225.1 hypothetical protein 201phi2-1p401 [Pseudomonas phage 201phi2-1]